jgi:hypothetical protein
VVDLKMVFKAIDEMTPEQLRQLYTHLADKQIEASLQISSPPPKKRVFGLGGEKPGFWMSDDFDDELPDEFWLGDEDDTLSS